MTFKLILKNIKGQLALNISLTILLSITITITLVASLLITGVNRLHDQAIVNVNGPQIIAYYEDTNLSNQEVEEHFANSEDIEKIDIIEMFQIKTIKNLPSELDSFVLLKTVYNPEYIDYNIITSKPTNDLADNEVYLPLFLRNNYEEGDVIISNDDIELKVVGFYEDPYLGSSFESSKTLLMNRNTFETINPHLKVSLVHLHFNDELTTKEITDFEKEYKHSSIYMFATTAQFKILSMMLPLMFSTILVAIALCLITVVTLVLIHTIKATIYNNYKEYGVMITLGFTRGYIIRTTILKNLFINTIAFIIGATASYFILPQIGNYVLYNTGMLWQNYFDFKILLVIFVILSLILSIISYISLRRIKRISVIRAISNKGPDYSFNSKVNINIIKLNSLPINIAYSVKKLLSNIRSYFSLLILSIVLTLTLVIVTSAFIAINDEDFVHNALGLPNSDLYISAQGANEDATQLIDEIDKKYEIKEYYITQLIPLNINDLNLSGIVYSSFDNVNDGTIVRGRFPTKPYEVTITPLISDKLEIGVSDTVTIAIDDTTEKYIVVGVAQSVAQAGNTLFIMDNESIPNEAFNVYNITFNDQSIVDEANDYIVDTYQEEFYVSKDSTFSIGDTTIISRIFLVISLIAYFVTVLFVAVISYMLAKMSIIKETRDIGILKSSGFSTKQIRVQFITRLKMLTVIGASIGIVIGKLYGMKLITPIFSAVGIAKLDDTSYWYTYLIPFTLMIFINLFFSFIATKKIKSIEIKDLINE